jgi:hypothetical protein
VGARPVHPIRHTSLADIDAKFEKLTMDSRRSPQRIGNAHLADQPANSNGTVGQPQRYLDFQRQYDLKPARCQRITVSDRTIASASYILGNSRQTPPNISRSIEMKGGLLERVRRSTLICCLKRYSRPQQVYHHSKDQSAQIQHRAAASPNS